MAKDHISRRYLRVLEPWKGGHHPFDTGLGNRLLHFDACYTLYLVSGGEHFLELEKRYWRELEFLELPGSREYDVNHHMEDAQHWLGTYDLNYKDDSITKLPKIGDKEVEHFLATGTLELPENRYYFDFEWGYVEKILRKAEELKIPSGLKRLRVKKVLLLREIQKLANGIVGIHIRRGNGVYKSKKDLAELPDTVLQNEYYTSIPGTIYKYWSDNKYISVMKEMLEINPKQKFYISCDLRDSEYIHLTEKFPGKIYTRKDIVKKLSDKIVDGINFEEEKDVRRVAIESIIDMMVLAYSSFIISAPHSTWIDSIARIRDVTYTHINSPKDELLKNYIINKERTLML